MKKNLSFWNTFQRFWIIISPFKFGLVIAITALIINAASDILIISLLKPFLDSELNKINQNILIWIPLKIITLMIVRGITGFIAVYSISWVSGNVVMRMRWRLFNHIIDMPVSFFDQQPTGTLLSRIMYDSEQIASSSSSALITIVREGASIVGISFMMFYYSWELSFIFIIIAPIVSFLIKYISIHFRNISKKIQNTMGQITTSAERMLKGHKEILIFGGQKLENENFTNISDTMRKQCMKMVAVSSFSDLLIQFIASLALALSLYVASIQNIVETLTAGTITAVFSLMIALMKPIKSLTNVNVQFQKGMAACQTLFSILDTETEKDEGEIEIDRVKGNITFDRVTFSYPNKELPSLYDICFSIPAGHMVALVGRSGSGKSTIVNLLMRFYDVQKGKILLDGTDLRSYKLSSLRNQVAIVSQNIHLFNDTIANNIAYARTEIYSRKQLENAARMAYAMEFIEKMENGLDTIVGENGILLSGGQRQRIAMARALLRDSPILILDEATSSLDTESEQAIKKTLETFQKNKTFLIIAHRLSTIERADEIFVVENGRIVERGNHIQLMSKRGIYAQLHHLQFEQTI